MIRKILLTILFTIFVSFGILWLIVDGGYDKQNKFILFLKQIIPTHLAREVRNTLFIIPNLKTENKILKQQVKKYEQGYQGQLFNEEKIVSTSGNTSFKLKEFFLPFPRLDNNLGWAATENSKRAHYLELIDESIFVISGLGETIYFKKENIDSKKLSQKKIQNNISMILKEKKAELIGIRDMFYEDGYLYISLQLKDKNGFTINVYRAKVSYNKLEFEKFFETKEYWQNYNVFSGGRIEKFKNNKILFSIGFSKNYKAPQNKESFLGKIIAIDKSSKEYELVSYGHRNPQGLYFSKIANLIINTEHGPKGGDEINFNFLNKNKTIPNFGWPISSLGSPYKGEEKIFKANGWLQKSHTENGFMEPFKYFTPAIGISEIIFTSSKKLYVSSLRAGSIYVLNLDSNYEKILKEDRLFFGNKRIRDLKFDQENNQFFVIFEYTPSIGVIKLN
jgi:glucose/arabinose dehydrogenase